MQFHRQLVIAGPAFKEGKAVLISPAVLTNSDIHHRPNSGLPSVCKSWRPGTLDLDLRGLNYLRLLYLKISLAILCVGVDLRKIKTSIYTTWAHERQSTTLIFWVLEWVHIKRGCAGTGCLITHVGKLGSRHLKRAKSNTFAAAKTWKESWKKMFSWAYLYHCLNIKPRVDLNRIVFPLT